MQRRNSSFYFLFVVFSYVSGHIVGYLSSITVELFHNRYHGYPSFYLKDSDSVKSFLDYISSEESEKHAVSRLLSPSWSKAKWLVLFILLFPISGLELVFGSMLGFNKYYTRCFSPLVSEMLEKKANDFFKGYKFGDEEGVLEWREHNYVRVLYHFSLEKASSHPAKLQNYVALYGFLRNLSFCFLIFSWWVFVIFLVNINFGYAIFAFVLFFTSFVLFLSFVKFYRRFSLESVMAFLSVENQFSKGEAEN